MKEWLDELNRRNVVRVGIAYVAIAWLVLQFADLVLENLNAPAWVMQALMLALLLGLPVVLLFAWAFELTPEGLKTTHEVDRSESIAHGTGRRLDRAIIVVLTVALGYFIWERLDPQSDTEVTIASGEDGTSSGGIEGPMQRSIAVLPFHDMTAGEDQGWFADGLAEEILNTLARVPDLMVAARTSSFAYRDSIEGIPTIARALGVEHVLEGSVRRGGDRLRVSVKLVRASDGFTIWAEEYDRDYADLIVTQENIATEIAAALKTAVDPEKLAAFVASGTNSIAAYELYLRGGSAFTTAVAHGSTKLMLAAKAAHEAAIRVDPNFAGPYARLAVFWRNQANTALINNDITDATKEEALEEFDRLIARAIELEPSRYRRILYRSWSARTHFRLLDALALLEDYLRVYRYDLNAQSNKLVLLMELGLHDAIGEQIWNLEDQGLINASLMVWSLIGIRYVDDPDQTRRLINIALQRYPDYELVLYQAHRAWLDIGELDQAARLLPLIEASDMPSHTTLLASLRQACAALRFDDAQALYEAGLRQEYDQPGRVWIMHSIMGRDELAVESLKPFDNQSGLSVLADRLQYAHFDHRRFPYMAERLGDTLKTRGEPRPLPYRCRENSDL